MYARLSRYPESPIATSVEEIEAVLVETARRGVRQILQQALEPEIEAHLETNRAKIDNDGHRQVVRNGHAPERTILTGAGVGPLEIARPRVDESNDPDDEAWFMRNELSIELAVKLEAVRRYHKDLFVRSYEDEDLRCPSAEPLDR